MPPSAAIAMLAAGDASPELTTAFDAKVLHTVVAYLPFVLAELPVGHALRARVVHARELALARLASPYLVLDVGYFSVVDPQAAGVEAVIASLGGDERPGKDDGMRERAVRGARLTLKRYSYGAPPQTGVTVTVKLAPAELDARATAALAPVVANVSWLTASPWALVPALRGDDFAALVARVAGTPVPAGGWEQSPLASCSKLVDRAAKKLGVSREAAALYLQYLVLMWPTPKLVQKWNGWSSKQFAAANDELVAADLVLAAKRERAARAHFLPGAWEATKSPHPPFETWKLPMYGERRQDGLLLANHGNFQLYAPFHVAFERAWKRIEDGDVPKYEDVRR
jgi:hypothetical protein